MRAAFFSAILAMAIIVASSNYLVQFPLNVRIFSIDLSNILTLGAFTYPIAFLVTDISNKFFGPQRARIVVLIGFIIAVIWSVFLASPRIAIASGTAFLLAQLFDISIFNRLREAKWWQAPLISSLLASLLDSLVFFTLAFSAKFAFLDLFFQQKDSSLSFMVPLLDISFMVPLWFSLAFGDFLVKIIIALLLLFPYWGFIRFRITNRIN